MTADRTDTPRHGAMLEAYPLAAGSSTLPIQAAAEQPWQGWAPPAIVVNAHHKTVHLDEAAIAYLKGSGGALNESLEHLVRAELATEIRAGLQRAFATGDLTLSPPVAVGFDGKYRHVCVQFRPVLKPGDTERTCVVCFIEAGVPQALQPGNADAVPPAAADHARRITESEERLRLANEAAGIGTFSVDAKSGLAHYSPELIEMLGFPGVATVKIDQAFRRIHRDDVARAAQLYSNAQNPAGDGHLRMEFRFVRPGGEIRWMIWNGRFQFADTPSGRQAVRVVGVCIDVTNRKLAEEALRASEARYRSVVEGSLQGIVIQQDERIVYANSAMARIFGYESAEGLIGKSTLNDFVAPEERDVLRARTAAAYRGEPLKPHPGWRGFRLDGQEIWVSAMAHVAEWQGQPAVVSFYLDVTERKLGERRLNETLRLMKLACSAGRMGTWHFNFRDMKPDFSDEALALLGIEKRTWKKSLEQLITVVHPDDQKKWRQVVQDTITNKSDVELEYRIVRPDNDVRWILSRGHVLKEASGQDFEGLGVLLDITEQKRSEERQQMLLRELDHRVKNSLTNLQLVLERSHVPTMSVDEFKRALQDRLTSMSLTHSRLSKGGWTGVGLADIVKDSLAPYRNEHNARIKGPTVVLKPTASQALAMVMCELATNAAKYGALSAATGQVLVRWQVENETTATGFPKSLAIVWEETGHTPVVAAARKGYGTSVIRELIPYELKGSTSTLNISPSGVHCRIEIPARFLVMHSAPRTGA